MKLWRIWLAAGLVLSLSAAIIMAQEKTEPGYSDTTKQQYEKTEAAMPMGPPQQIKESAHLIGTWKFAGEMKMEPGATEWVPFEATATFSYVCGEAAIQMDYRMPSPMGEMIGLSISTYDRERNEWQDMWVDNWTGQMMMMTGQEKDSKRVMSGKSLWQGQETYMRNTSWDMTETSFKWQMEESEDGKNWTISMKGEYTKQ